MVLSAEEKRARRMAGTEKAKLAMTPAEKVHRGLTTGRPMSSEFRTPLEAVTAARMLHRELEARLTAEGLSPAAGDWAVSIGYVTPDLSTIGFTPLYAPGVEGVLIQMLVGNIMTGLVFGVVDRAEGKREILMGARPFLTTKLTEGWLSELFLVVRAEIEDDLR